MKSLKNHVDFIRVTLSSKRYCPYLGYVQSKLALVAYVRYIGTTMFHRHGFAMNAVHPGVVDTSFYTNPIIRALARIAFIVSSCFAILT